MTYTTARKPNTNGEANRLLAEDQPVHGWYRFVLSYPPHLVRDYLERFGISDDDTVLDPFCGTGTTLVECKKRGISSVGIEANPLPCYAARTKTDWRPEPDDLVIVAASVAASAISQLESDGIEDNGIFPSVPDNGTLRTLPTAAMDILLAGSISPLPLHKVLVLLDLIHQHGSSRCLDHLLLAVARILPSTVGNLQFGPEVGVGPQKADTSVVDPWLRAVHGTAADLRQVRHLSDVPAEVHLADARSFCAAIPPRSVSAVITSPPYPNEKDYTRLTRLESVVLGFISGKAELRDLKHALVRSNTRGVYKADDDDTWADTHPEVERIAREIEERRIALGKTSGFERQYARVTRLYFGGMARHLADLRSCLRPGAQLAYVVGDQASYLRVMIRTGQILADIAQSLGYEVTGIDLFRTRLATATKEHLREEVLLLRWPGTET